MLRAVESSATQSLRLTLTRQLAEVLLRGVSGAVYSCPERVTETTGQFQHLCESSCLVSDIYARNLTFESSWIYCR